MSKENRIKIGIREIGAGAPVYIIAEMSANHGGSLAKAKEIIYAAKEAGADCIKLQTYTPDTLTIDCRRKEFCITHGSWSGRTLYQLYQQAFTPWEWQAELKETAKEVGLDFFSTPFDVSAVDFLEEIDVACYKVASFELVDLPLIHYIASKGKPIILSTGLAALAEIDEAVRTVRDTGNRQLALLRCASAYPAVADGMNLYTMQNMQQVFGVPVGLSDHSKGSVGAVAAVALGACIIEKHFCLNQRDNTEDSFFSMTPKEFSQMVEDVRQAQQALGTVSYGPTKQEQENLKFRRSLFCVEDIKKGEVLTEKNIRIIRPGYGLAPKYYRQVLGQRALRDIDRGTPLQFELIGMP